MDKSNYTLHPMITCTYIRSASPPVKLRVIFLNLNLLHIWPKKTYGWYFIHLPMKMELIEGSETSAISTVTPGITQKNILHTEHGESLK